MDDTVAAPADSPLVEAINRNTEAVLAMANGLGLQAQAIHRLADECVTLATMLADPEGEAQPAVDMAGRPIKVG